MLLPIVALAPAIGLAWLLASGNREPRPGLAMLSALFLLGGASAGLALVLNHLVERYTALWSEAPEISLRLAFWLLGIGLNEEFSKLLVLLVFVYPREEYRSPYQGLLAAATVALGFAALENLVYLGRYGTPTLLVRSLLTVPAHAGFTIPAGVCLIYSRQAGPLYRRYLWLVAGLGAAIALHGVYNIWLSLDQEWLNRMAYVQVLLMIALASQLMRLKDPLPAPPGGEVAP